MFTHSKASDANIGIIANFGSFEKPLNTWLIWQILFKLQNEKLEWP